MFCRGSKLFLSNPREVNFFFWVLLSLFLEMTKISFSLMKSEQILIDFSLFRRVLETS